MYEGEIDNIIGILSVSDLMIQARKQPIQDIDIRPFLKQPYFVPENRRTDVLFKEMQRSKTKLAILIDEYGGVSGLVTLEDLIEEIVGEIHDEYEEVEPQFVELIPHSTYQVSGGISIFDLNEALPLNINSICDTLSGYLMEQLGYIPNPQQLPLTLSTSEADYEIEVMEDKVISCVRLVLKEQKQRNEAQELKGP